MKKRDKAGKVLIFFKFMLETLQHLGHIASRIFVCLSEGCVFLLLLCRPNRCFFVKFTDLIFYDL